MISDDQEECNEQTVVRFLTSGAARVGTLPHLAEPGDQEMRKTK